MFYCAISGKLSRPGDKAISLVTERRTKEYATSSFDKDGTEQRTVHGVGWEIVKEVTVTLEGLRMWCDTNPQDVESRARYVGLLRAEELRKKNALREGIRSDDSEPALQVA